MNTQMQTAAEFPLLSRALSTSSPLLEAAQCDALYAFARHLYDEGDVSQAVIVFRLLALVQPMRSRSWLGLGACHEVHADMDRALDLYALAASVENDGENAVHARLHRARVLLERGETSEARDAVADLHIDDLALVESDELKQAFHAARGR